VGLEQHVRNRIRFPRRPTLRRIRVRWRDIAYTAIRVSEEDRFFERRRFLHAESQLDQSLSGYRDQPEIADPDCLKVQRHSGILRAGFDRAHKELGPVMKPAIDG